MRPPEGPRDSEVALRRLFHGLTPRVGEPPAELEERVLAHFGRRRPAAPRPTPSRWMAVRRYAIAGVAAASLVGACRLPVAYERSFGAHLECALARERVDEGLAGGAVDRLRLGLAADSVSLRVEDRGGPTTSLAIDAWGGFEDPEEVLARARQAMPALAAAECSSEALTGTVHGTLGGRLGHRLWALELDEGDAEATRLRIVEALRAQGFRGSAEVEVRDEEGRRAVEIRLEERVEGEGTHPPAGGGPPVGG